MLYCIKARHFGQLNDALVNVRCFKRFGQPRFPQAHAHRGEGFGRFRHGNRHIHLCAIHEIRDQQYPQRAFADVGQRRLAGTDHRCVPLRGIVNGSGENADGI